MTKTPLILGLVFALIAVPAKAQLQPTTAQSPTTSLAVYAYPVSALMDACPADVGGINWDWRQAIFGAFNYLFAPNLQTNYHPLLDPNVGTFTSFYHKLRFQHVLDILNFWPRPAPGQARVIQLYSSGYVVQTAGSTIAYDISVDIFNPSPMTPYLQGVDPSQLDALAGLVDCMFISHIHLDHMTPYLIQAVAQLNKPVYVTQEIKDYALGAGAIWADQLIVPQTGVTYTLSIGAPNTGVSPETMTMTCYQGIQYMGFLDAAQTIGDPTNPYNVQDNCYLVNVTSADQSTNFTFGHNGDNNDPGYTAFAASSAAAGWHPDVWANLGGFSSSFLPFYGGYNARILTAHVMELHHFLGAGLGLYPAQTAPNMSQVALSWGDSFLVNL